MSFSKVVFCLLISHLVIFNLALTAAFAAVSSNCPVSRSITLKANDDIEAQKHSASHELDAAAGLDRKNLANPLLSGEKNFNEGNYPAALVAYEVALEQYADLVEKTYASVKTAGQRDDGARQEWLRTAAAALLVSGLPCRRYSELKRCWHERRRALLPAGGRCRVWCFCEGVTLVANDYS